MLSRNPRTPGLASFWGPLARPWRCWVRVPGRSTPGFLDGDVSTCRMNEVTRVFSGGTSIRRTWIGSPVLLLTHRALVRCSSGVYRSAASRHRTSSRLQPSRTYSGRPPSGSFAYRSPMPKLCSYSRIPTLPPRKRGMGMQDDGRRQRTHRTRNGSVSCGARRVPRIAYTCMPVRAGPLVLRTGDTHILACDFRRVCSHLGRELPWQFSERHTSRFRLPRTPLPCRTRSWTPSSRTFPSDDLLSCRLRQLQCKRAARREGFVSPRNFKNYGAIRFVNMCRRSKASNHPLTVKPIGGVGSDE